MALLLKLISQPGKGEATSEVKRFDQEGGSIGRADHCELHLPDTSKQVSKIHALVHFRDQEYFITDLSLIHI